MDKELTEDRKFTVNVSSPDGCKRVLEIHVPEEELERERTAVIRVAQGPASSGVSQG